MAIRKRSNEILSWIAVILGLFNVYLWQSGSDKVKRRIVDESSNYSYVNPPPCGNATLEAIRLNEVIANTWYKCRRSKRLPDESMGYHICLDEGAGIGLFGKDGLNVVTLSGPMDDFRLEETLLKILDGSPNLRLLILNTRKQSPHRLKSHSEPVLQYKSINLESLDAKQLMQQLVEFRNQQPIDLLKIDCVDCSRSDHLATLLRQLQQSNGLDGVRQLHLTIRIEEADEEVLYTWYLTLYGLFINVYGGDGFALYAAQQLGFCGRTVQSCQYQLSFIRTKQQKGDIIPFLAPIAGAGSPDEEYNRLIWYLSQHHEHECEDNRQSIRFGDLNRNWTICGSNFNENHSKCSIYYFGIGDGQMIINGRKSSILPNDCSVRLFDPTLAKDEQYPEDRLQSYSVTLGDHDAETVQPGIDENQDWHIVSLNTALKIGGASNSPISLMVFDLHGGEWDVFEQILRAAAVPMFSQLVMRIRVWSGEENENYRQFYSWFVRLEELGFVPFGFLPVLRDVGLYEELICKPKWCYELGWRLQK